jgi:hypothetical protein
MKPKQDSIKQIVILIYLHRRNPMGAIRRIFAPSPPAYTPPPVAAAPAPVAPAPVAAPEALAPEVEVAPEMSESIKKKKKGSYSTLLTGKGGSLGSPDIERKSILGG